MILTAQQLAEYINKNGMQLVKLTNDFNMSSLRFPANTPIYINLEIGRGRLSSYSKDTKNKNLELGYGSKYPNHQNNSNWHYYYKGLFLIGSDSIMNDNIFNNICLNPEIE